MIATRVGWAGPHLSYIDNINYFTQTYIEVQVLLRPEVTLDQYNSGFLRVQVEGGQEVDLFREDFRKCCFTSMGNRYKASIL